MSEFVPTGTMFINKPTGQLMMLVTDGHYAGWIVYKHPDGQWVTLRKATNEDMRAIDAAVIKAHHED